MNINSAKETKRITDFIHCVVNKARLKKVVIGLSGGIDSTVSLYLLRKVLDDKNIITVNLPYFDAAKENTNIINIKDLVDDFKSKLQIGDEDKVRIGNIMARIRMIVLFDLAKKNNALVCGTENKSEYYLGYFTRFGDEASDFEPIRHLYKTQVYELAQYLEVPKEIIEKKPSADLWVGQSDEIELGFAYEEADPVLYLYFEKKQSIEEIEKQGFKKVRLIIDTALKNEFKHKVPYYIK